jgi:hypothetical protein
MYDVVSLVSEHDEDCVKQPQQSQWREHWEKPGSEVCFAGKIPHAIARNNTSHKGYSQVLQGAGHFGT